jgi:hypothetical protein
MNLENQLLEKFQVEELEKRYEFAWVDSVEVSVTVPIEGKPLTVKADFDLK